MEFDQRLFEEYRDKIGVREDGDYPKSHWPDCTWGNPDSKSRIVLPIEAPARLVSCNACLRRHGYIRVVVCNPRFKGWPSVESVHTEFTRKGEPAVCEFTDCETWLRVKDVGQGVEQVLQRLDPNAWHPVTWIDTGILPFHELGTETDDLYFETKEELEQYCKRLDPEMLVD